MGANAASARLPIPLKGDPPLEYSGFCRACNAVHRIANQPGLALDALTSLFDRLDSDSTLREERAALAQPPGKMIGVLVTDSAVLRAYSGELGGRRDWPGWVGPVLRRQDTAELEEVTLKAIAGLNDRIEAIDVGKAQRHLDESRIRFRKQSAPIEEAKARLLADRSRLAELRRERRRASQRLSTAIFDAARVTSAGGRRLPLKDVFIGARIPGGTTDCCVPKLLEAANVSRLRPIALAEAWWGPTIGGRHHGDLQPPCERKCLPILGHLLCGT